MGRTQQGSNNAYCQDNEISWVDWSLDDRARRLLGFTRGLIQFRKAHAELQRRKFFQGRPLCSANMKDLTWHRPDGGEMAEAEWRQATLRAFGFRLCGDAMDDVDERGEPITDDTLLILLNAEPESVDFVLPIAHPGAGWDVEVDTGEAGMLDPSCAWLILSRAIPPSGLAKRSRSSSSWRRSGRGSGGTDGRWRSRRSR